MGRSITTVCASHADRQPLEYSVEHEDSEAPSRDELAFQLLLLAQEHHTLIPDGRRGANREERLAEYGYHIGSIATTLAE